MKYRIRRLTPVECERLQGFPDGWTDIGEYEANGKKQNSSDSKRYRALGNSIAVNCWDGVLHRIADRCTEKTMASLFDGIGGFPLVWNQYGTTVWTSEIDSFCDAVTKRRFAADDSRRNTTD